MSCFPTSLLSQKLAKSEGRNSFKNQKLSVVFLLIHNVYECLVFMSEFRPLIQRPSASSSNSKKKNEPPQMSTTRFNSRDKTDDESIPMGMWKAAMLVAIQSFLFGYVYSCFNACLVTGDNKSGSDCYHGTDSSCPKGTVYNDLNLTTCMTTLIYPG